jgi:hypothetical protein
VVGFGRVYKICGRTIPFSQYFTVSISGGVWRFVPMVMAVDIGNATGALGLFQILVSFSQFCYVVLCSS